VNYNGLKVYHYPSRLEEEVKARINEKSTVIARDAFGPQMKFEDVREHVTGNSIETLLINESAFSSYRKYNLKESTVLHNVGAAVMRSEQGKGIYRMLNETAIESELNKNCKTFLTGRTQNPSVYASIRKIKSVKSVYPSKEKPPDYILDVKEEISKLFGKRVDDNFKIDGVYGKCLYNYKPKCRDEIVNKMFYDLLNHEKGDALLIIAEIR